MSDKPGASADGGILLRAPSDAAVVVGVDPMSNRIAIRGVVAIALGCIVFIGAGSMMGHEESKSLSMVLSAAAGSLAGLMSNKMKQM